MKIIFLIASSIMAASVFGTALVPLDVSSAKVQVPYTMGTHVLEGKGFSGSLKIDEGTQHIVEGRVKLPVVGLTGEKKTLVCHMQEALTLDYEKSDFPEDHVCEDDKLPTEGKNAPVFAEIEAQLLRPVPFGGSSLLLKWTIHGVTKEEEIPATITWDKENRKLSIRSQFSLNRKDFNITVKKFLFIGVDEKILLDLNLTFGVE